MNGTIIFTEGVFKLPKNIYPVYDYKGQLRGRIEKHLSEGSPKSMLVICDFADIPVALGDVVCLLWNADIIRKKKGLDAIDVVFIGHASDPCLPGLPYANKDNFRHYLHNLGVEATRLVKSVGNIFTFNNRQSFVDFWLTFKDKYNVIYPADYDYLYPLEHRDDRPACYWYRCSKDAVEQDPSLLTLNIEKEYVDLIKKWFSCFVHPDVPVSISLRQCPPEERGSSISAWQKLIDYYKGSDIKFVVLQDYVKLYNKPSLVGENVIYYDAPVLLLPLRAALYQECTLNLFVQNGPAMLAHLNDKVHYIIFKYQIPAFHGVCNPRAIERIFSVKAPQNFIGANKYQKIVWEPDDFEVMKVHTDKMIEVLKKDGLWK